MTSARRGNSTGPGGALGFTGGSTLTTSTFFGGFTLGGSVFTVSVLEGSGFVWVSRSGMGCGMGGALRVTGRRDGTVTALMLPTALVAITAEAILGGVSIRGGGSANCF